MAGERQVVAASAWTYANRSGGRSASSVSVAPAASFAKLPGASHTRPGPMRPGRPVRGRVHPPARANPGKADMRTVVAFAPILACAASNNPYGVGHDKTSSVRIVLPRYTRGDRGARS